MEGPVTVQLLHDGPMFLAFSAEGHRSVMHMSHEESPKKKLSKNYMTQPQTKRQDSGITAL